jgi:hypothetical protein
MSTIRRNDISYWRQYTVKLPIEVPITFRLHWGISYESPEGSFEIQDSKFENRDSISEIRNSRFEIQYLKQPIKRKLLN